MDGVSAYTLCSSIRTLQYKSHTSGLCHRLISLNPPILHFPHTKVKNQLGLRTDGSTIRCSSSTGPGGFGSGEGDSRDVLDAFFLGKALAEAVNERVESAIGELLSTVGRLQAEQQRQIQEFQEDVLERAKMAKEKAAREALEARGLAPKPSSVDATPTVNGAVSGYSSSPNEGTNNTSGDPDAAGEDPLIGVSDDG